MCAGHLKIVARNTRATQDDDCERRGPAPQFYELELSDEHMAHVARFRRLGPFDRKQWLLMRGMIRWKLAEIKAQRARDNLLTAEQLEQQRLEADDPNCWMCGGDGECERYNEEAGHEETFTCPECQATDNGEGA